MLRKNGKSLSSQQKGSIQSGCFLFVVRPSGFEPLAYRVGVIRPSSQKALQRKGLVGVTQISAIMEKNLGSLIGQGFRGFSR